MAEGTRIERDSMGEMEVPADALYGASTQRAVLNFPVSGWTIPEQLISALGRVKHAAATANEAVGKLDSKIADLIRQAATEVIEGKLNQHFPIDVFQTGSGTSSNMNTNEVIANRAGEIMGADRGSKTVHPNDHVNMGQSTNDMFPTAIHVAGALQLANDLVPALEKFQGVMDDKAKEFDDIIKIGRTHLSDATPIRLGQVFLGFSGQLDRAITGAKSAMATLAELPCGGTAVGTGINTHPEFAAEVSKALNMETGIPFRPSPNKIATNATRDGLVEASGQIRMIALVLFKIANETRWLSSGPRCGIGEIQLPEIQPGSSIMPGKVNPVMCESLMQVAARVIGNDETIAFGNATGANFELNIMMPVMGDAVIESIRLLAQAVHAFVDNCASGITANRERCEELVEQSLAMCTSLAPHIGYDKSAALAHQAFEEGKTIRQVASEGQVMPEDELNKALDPRSMTEPSK